MKIAKDTVATLSYTVTETTGQVVGRTEPGQPVTALIGHRFLVKGLENALLGHEKGDEFAVTLEPKDTYGEIDESLIQTIDRKLFGDFEIAVGNVFEADSEQGPMAVVVKEIKDDVVIVDGNHPLAGKVLNFLIVVEDVREATEEEIKHGHAHVDGHCPSEHHHCCHHHDDEDGEHHCCHGHHHDDEDGEHHCCHGHHHDDEDGEHHCCHDHHHDYEDGEHECCCHKHDHE
ncbi:peptidylprolyl isomerase [Succinivibrio sp.]|uniref:FKBP-type peptidyl-prolyl cis-trans isomerase n=1 Tax=Succinivibrio sp. TaxID=2053619 RepID=UPI0025DECB95|nr:peptidylprolyl isomerase [Succinivibrio sp.]MBQ9220501.1 peptidylprolyl isomerase [Succinivibrio sp.]